jgi:ubiquinone/menaquinone biosynthesis C-methylase UbiE
MGVRPQPAMDNLRRPDRFSQFWEERARAFVRADPEGLAAVCLRGAPTYLNEFIAWSQERAIGRLLAAVPLVAGDPAADVGCGTGRWTRWLASRGLVATGFDISPTMVDKARELAPSLPFTVASATSLPLADESQAWVVSVTVLHHLPYERQAAAVAEARRILRPGGRYLTVALLTTLPSGHWCFPRSRRGWNGLFAGQGFELLAQTGEEFVTPAVVTQWAAAGFRALRTGVSRASDGAPGVGSGRGSRAYEALLRAAVTASYPLERALADRWPGGPATGLASLHIRR